MLTKIIIIYYTSIYWSTIIKIPNGDFMKVVFCPYWFSYFFWTNGYMFWGTFWLVINLLFYMFSLFSGYLESCRHFLVFFNWCISCNLFCSLFGMITLFYDDKYIKDILNMFASHLLTIKFYVKLRHACTLKPCSFFVFALMQKRRCCCLRCGRLQGLEKLRVNQVKEMVLHLPTI